MPATPPPAPDPALLERLARLGVPVGVPARSPTPARHPARMPIEEAVPGRAVANSLGACYVSDLRRSIDDVHAGESLESARMACTDSLAALASNPRLADHSLETAAFLDTETTGLSGGSGTYAFLIGAGRFENGAFVVRQFFMRDPTEEASQLHEFAEWVAPCRSIVTFNGRSFDVPLLTSRLSMHRLSSGFQQRPHLDLLHAARRIWRRRLPSCALTSLERHVLGLARQDDIPGWLIPHRYFSYQRDGDARGLVGIFHHNALDVLTMVSLAVRLAELYRSPESRVRHGHDWASLARVYDSAGERQRAIDAWENALERTGNVAEADEVLRQLSFTAKRMRRWPRALEIWRELAEDPAPRHVFPFVELAKYYEHHAKCLESALGFARRARELVAAGQLRPRRPRAVVLAELDHRIARLERRLNQSRAPAEVI